MADDEEIATPAEEKREPKETKWQDQKDADDEEIARFLQKAQEGGDTGVKFDDTPFDQTNKADDAEDFEDISDDDLPDEEEPSAGTSMEIPGLTDDGGTSNDADDLFGDGPSSPGLFGPSSPGAQVRDADIDANAETDADEIMEDTQPAEAPVDFSINFNTEPGFFGTNQDPNIPAPAESVEDLLKQAWPAFERGRVLVWSELFPQKHASWKEKKPPRKPRKLVTSKLTLELDQDTALAFRLPASSAPNGSRARRDATSGMVYCNRDQISEDEDAGQFNLDQNSDSESVFGFSMRDIELVCEDWDTHIDTVEAAFEARASAAKASAEAKKKARETELKAADADDAWDAEFLLGEDAADVRELLEDPEILSKPREKTSGLPAIPKYVAPSFDDFQGVTRRGAKRVQLDLDDPYLLLETQDSQRNAKRPRLDGSESKRTNGSLSGKATSRFNFSNDDAYDLLKENHKGKIRATLGNISVDHGMPAVKLTWPYYKVKLGGTTDEYHRPRFRYKKFAGHTIKFDKPHHHKRKAMRGKASDIYRTSKDLSMNDNATAVLFEYCEPRPRVLNNFAMGSKVINYYRRKEATDDDQLPRQDLGEYRTLLPEDRSPFSIFGTVDAGEIVPTLHNEMYRAPVFKHAPKSSDFLVVRNTTGTEGSKWYLHKIDHLHVVGQSFPSEEVPGPHSRKVTNASKNRMKMLAYRMIRHSKTANCQLSDITKHIADSTDTQNRQKLKEFLQYDRESGEKGMWRLRPGEPIHDENFIRAMIKPEQVCGLDAMQLGIKELEDAGYDPRNANLGDDAQAMDVDEPEDDDMASELEKGAGDGKKKIDPESLTPWRTTKAFIDACASKAMLALHGPGDPTGHDLGFSFLRTSMKGGYLEAIQGPQSTSADAMEKNKEKGNANNGHAYNVKDQQAKYEEGIRRIWGRQKETLSDATEHDPKDILANEDEDDRFNAQPTATPAMFDEGVSQISGFTSSSRHPKRAIRIIRKVTMPDGSTQDRIEVVHDPVVITQYMKRRADADMESREYVKALLRYPGLTKPSPRSWRRLPACVKAAYKWSLLADLKVARGQRATWGPGVPGIEADLVGFEFKAPAYTYISTASTRNLQAAPTRTVLQRLGKYFPPPSALSLCTASILTVLGAELRRNSTDSRRTRHEEKLENSRNSSSAALPPETLLPPSQTVAIRLSRARRGNARIVVFKDTLKPTKSMQNTFPHLSLLATPYPVPPSAPSSSPSSPSSPVRAVSPPPRASFDWFSTATANEANWKRRNKKKALFKSVLGAKMSQCDATNKRHGRKWDVLRKKAQNIAQDALRRQKTQQQRPPTKKWMKQQAQLEKERIERERADILERYQQQLQVETERCTSLGTRH